MSLGSAAQGLAASASATLPAALPPVQVGAAGTAQLAQNLALVEKPVKAAAAGVQRNQALLRAAGFLAKALPVATVTASALNGARIVDQTGTSASLVRTKAGRGAVLGAVGGALLLVPTPVTQVAAAGVLAGLAVNEFGGMSKLDANLPRTAPR